MSNYFKSPAISAAVSFIETTILMAAATLIGNYYAALQQGTPFDWHTQWLLFVASVATGLVKGLLAYIGTAKAPAA